MTGTLRPIREGLFTAKAGRVRLLAGRCDACDVHHFPASARCPYCGGAAQPDHVGPTGRVVLCTVVGRQPPGYTGPVPYGFGVVRIDATRLEVITRLSGPDPAAIRPGMAVVLDVEQVPGDGGEPAAVWTFRVEGS